MILTHTRDEVAELNDLARDRLRQHHELGIEYRLTTSRGERLFASGDRIMFLRNEGSLGVKNGSLGAIESVTPTRMAVLMDDGRSVAFDVKGLCGHRPRLCGHHPQIAGRDSRSHACAGDTGARPSRDLCGVVTPPGQRRASLWP